MAFPENNPEWAIADTYPNGSPNKIRPDPALRQYGYPEQATVTSQELNWQLNNLYLQIQELKTINASAFQTPVNELKYIVGDDRNPAVIYGYGQWVRYAEGRVVIGSGSSTDTNNFRQTFPSGSTGGTHRETLSASQIPTHAHNYDNTYLFETNTVLGGVPEANKKRVGFINGGIGTGAFNFDNDTLVFTKDVTEPVGGNQPINNLPPYIACNIWLRIA
jgi:microcystin-dependent protein